MSNPFFSRSAAFNGRGPAAEQTTPAGYPAMPGYQPGQYGRPGQTGGPVAPATAQAGYGRTAVNEYGQPIPTPADAQAAMNQYAQTGYGTVSPQQLAGLESQYAAPAATNVDRGRMTYDDVIVRTAMMFAVIVGVGAVSWILATTPATAGLGYLLMFVGALGALGLGLVNSFKREPSPALIVLYSVFEGAMLGAFSGVMNAWYPGIVVQAVTGTLAVFLFMLVAYRVGFRLSGRAKRILLFAIGGYALFSLVNFGLMALDINNSPWGMRTSVEIMGIPLGLILGPLAIFMAALCLAMDFESIENGVRHGLPKKYAWAGAFGLVVTLVWLYLEILRLLAIFRE
ncbi:MAG: Bax inhibitor-1/YccA family protein [Actinomyces sp.]|uniref:Bax inhibitor-1/YccA family protein n=1 Tax=Actinomyces sp. TaxID=29317 RepID=UPI0026DA8A6F|nr:Bax inhibitor-1/YccA family protein [Actinomyces sp.]MDO4243218.1 Bax inhibitor-1/YccA family protein [Actinomyces sp.]